MRCLVTGATGYIGGRLAPRLIEAGHSVRCLSRNAVRLRDMPWARQVEIVEGDLSDPVTLAPAFEPLDYVIAAGLVPACAMKVSRGSEGGPEALFTPSAPCGCYYESKVPMGSTSCTVCTDNTPCGGGMCRHGYCEAK